MQSAIWIAVIPSLNLLILWLELSSPHNRLLPWSSRGSVSPRWRLGIAPHVADKILNHQSGTISGVAAVYQRHEFLAERRAALELVGSPCRPDSQKTRVASTEAS
jgi:hypothetical protein